jgi:hypothetical protein
VLLSVTALAQQHPAPPVSLELPARLSLPPLYPSERLRLTYPVTPLRFTFSEVRPLGLGATRGPSAYFTAESVWLEAGALSLRTRAESVEAIGLDCSGLTCVPTTELSVTGEVRLDLGAPAGSRVVPETYVYARHKRFMTPSQELAQPLPGQFQFGFGGLLDL